MASDMVRYGGGGSSLVSGRVQRELANVDNHGYVQVHRMEVATTVNVIHGQLSELQMDMGMASIGRTAAALGRRADSPLAFEDCRRLAQAHADGLVYRLGRFNLDY